MTTAAAIDTRNPATGAPLARYEAHDPPAVDALLARARTAFATWRRTSFAERAGVLRAAARILRAEKTRIGAIAVREMGKPIVEAEAEVEKCAVCCEHYADHASGYLAETEAPSTATRSYVAFRPLGVVLAVMPWNFPYWQVFRFAAPALMAGNVGVLKHATNVTECALEIERIFARAGAPSGTFATLLVAGRDMEAIVADPRIAAVTLTGSEGAGSAVAAAAGKRLKPSVLELGGSDFFIVLADADLAAAAKIGVRSRFQNAGQSCIAAKRFIVVDAVYDRFLELFVAEARTLRVGDPTDRSTSIGPLARADLRDALADQIARTLDRGARLVLGGAAIPGPGAYFEPTVVAEVTSEMPMFREETFGPAASFTRARDVSDAVRLANASDFGLGGNLWTGDVAAAERIAADLETGGVFINGMTASDPRLPFGGVKKSGYGRELSSFGIREFVNVQTVWIGPPRDGGSPAPAE